MPPTILIVDDEIHLARILQFTMEHAGYRAIVAHDGKDALEKVCCCSPDLIILDLMLPVIDGYKVCNRVKDNPHHKHIPVIILSARDLSKESIEEPIRAECFMAKPFNTEVLLAKIAELLASRSCGASGDGSPVTGAA